MAETGEQVALVTGASRGIGAAVAEVLAAAGAHVVLTARTQGGLEEVEARIHAGGGSATIAPLDLRDGDGIDRLAAAIGARWGKLDILLLNAATLGSLGPLAHADPKEFEALMALNVTASWRLLRGCDPWLRGAPSARVVTLSSSVATRPRAYWGPYAASKAALDTLALTYADEVRNISALRVVVVNPGATRTAMRARAYPGEDPATLRPPEGVAAALVALLASDFATASRIDL